jgi:prepilin-type N-terminal cleavage/methylation domain-containing protein
LAMKLVAWADERGMNLIETLVALAIVSIVLTGFLAALSTGAFGVATVRQRVTAENLARAQLEYTKDYTYTVGATSYPIVEHPESYPITIDISYWDPATKTFVSDQDVDDNCCGMQWITITVSHGGEPVFRAIDYKLSR